MKIFCHVDWGVGADPGWELEMLTVVHSKGRLCTMKTCSILVVLPLRPTDLEILLDQGSIIFFL